MINTQFFRELASSTEMVTATHMTALAELIANPSTGAAEQLWLHFYQHRLRVRLFKQYVQAEVPMISGC